VVVALSVTRHSRLRKAAPATAIPNATCLAATFSHDLAHAAGGLLADEAKARDAVCLLAPTVNIARSPRGGRAFESFSEDPTLSGLLASSYISGLQDNGVSAVIKHFVTNDQEHERTGYDAVVAPRPLREIYLRPFQIAQRRSQPWAYMTAYNRLNGRHCSENPWLLDDVLRGEFRHDGLVMSDWYGTYSVAGAINAGLSLEMPGPAIWRDPKLVKHVLSAHKVDMRTLDSSAACVLRFTQRLAQLNPDIVYAPPRQERTRVYERKKDEQLVRRIAGEGIVLLKNEQDILPLGKNAAALKVAVIGPNAKARVLTGGGSAHLRSAWSQSPWEGLVDNCPQHVDLSYSLGCQTSKYLPLLDGDFSCMDGSSGFDVYHFALAPDGSRTDTPVLRERREESELMMIDFHHPDLEGDYVTEIHAILDAPQTGEYEFGVTVTGQGWLYVDDLLVVDNATDQTRGGSYLDGGTYEVRGRVQVDQGKVGPSISPRRRNRVLTLPGPQKYHIRMVHDSRRPATKKPVPSTPFMHIKACRLGAAPYATKAESLQRAVELASASDVAVVVAGLNPDWEAEGFDRPNLALPPGSDELIARVAAVVPTVVVIQCGSAVTMPWVNGVRAVVHAWYGGNETGNAIADLLYGEICPSGRLPLTFPLKEEDVPAFLSFKSGRTETHYEEGIWVGYKHYNARGIAPLFPFGHGLSYTSFAYDDLRIESVSPSPCQANDWSLAVAVTVTNTGTCGGSHSVHFYTAPPDPNDTSLVHPAHTFQAFSKTRLLAPGECERVHVELDKCEGPSSCYL
jgi:beta-glucosidase